MKFFSRSNGKRSFFDSKNKNNLSSKPQRHKDSDEEDPTCSVRSNSTSSSVGNNEASSYVRRVRFALDQTQVCHQRQSVSNATLWYTPCDYQLFHKAYNRQAKCVMKGIVAKASGTKQSQLQLAQSQIEQATLLLKAYKACQEEPSSTLEMQETIQQLVQLHQSKQKHQQQHQPVTTESSEDESKCSCCLTGLEQLLMREAFNIDAQCTQRRMLNRIRSLQAAKFLNNDESSRDETIAQLIGKSSQTDTWYAIYLAHCLAASVICET